MRLPNVPTADESRLLVSDRFVASGTCGESQDSTDGRSRPVLRMIRRGSRHWQASASSAACIDRAFSDLAGCVDVRDPRVRRLGPFGETWQGVQFERLDS